MGEIILVEDEQTKALLAKLAQRFAVGNGLIYEFFEIPVTRWVVRQENNPILIRDVTMNMRRTAYGNMLFFEPGGSFGGTQNRRRFANTSRSVEVPISEIMLNSEIRPRAERLIMDSLNVAWKMAHTLRPEGF